MCRINFATRKLSAIGSSLILPKVHQIRPTKNQRRQRGSGDFILFEALKENAIISW
jgi:hypothetical protein